MQVKSPVLGLAGMLLSSCAATAEASAQDRDIVVRTSEAERPAATFVELRGKTSDSSSYSVTATVNANEVVISANLAGRPLGVGALHVGDFPQVDIRSMEVGYLPGRLIVSIDYGEAHAGCVVNDDGRDVVTIAFTADKPPVQRVLHWDCERGG